MDRHTDTDHLNPVWAAWPSWAAGTSAALFLGDSSCERKLSVVSSPKQQRDVQACRGAVGWAGRQKLSSQLSELSTNAITCCSLDKSVRVKKKKEKAVATTRSQLDSSPGRASLVSFSLGVGAQVSAQAVIYCSCSSLLPWLTVLTQPMLFR